MRPRLFNYSKLKRNKKNPLKEYLKQLSSLKKEEFKTFNEDEKLSFLINAYNAFTVKLILDNYPLKSIKDIGTLFSSPWKKKFIFLFGKKTHLDEIEHKMIRENFNEPRIHFAVVCASIGCPPLQEKAYVANRLNNQLEKAARDFLNDRNKNYYKLNKKRLYLSKIFKWYAKDFERKYGSVISAIIPYLKESQLKEALNRDDFEIRYSAYDWSLNEM